MNTIRRTCGPRSCLSQSQGLTQELQSQSEELQASGGSCSSRTRNSRNGCLPEGLGGAAADAAGGAAADKRGARREGTAARGAESPHRDQEPRDRAGSRSARGEGAGARPVVSLQVGVPGEHVARAPDAAEQLLILAKMLGANQEKNLKVKQKELAATIYGAGSDLLGPDQRDPRPLEGRGRARSTQRQRCQDGRGERVRRAQVPAGR